MTYVIAEPCVDQMDQSCVAVCPVDCISGEGGVDRKMHIDGGDLYRSRAERKRQKKERQKQREDA